MSDKQLLHDYVTHAYGINMSDAEIETLTAQMPDLLGKLKQQVAESNDNITQQRFDIANAPMISPYSLSSGSTRMDVMQDPYKANQDTGGPAPMTGFSGGQGFLPGQDQSISGDVPSGNLLNFVGGAAWGFGDTFTFGLGSIVDKHLFGHGVERFLAGGVASKGEQTTRAAQWGTGVGTIGGFMNPMNLVRKGVGKAVTGVGGRLFGTGVKGSSRSFARQANKILKKEGFNKSLRASIINPYRQSIANIGKNVKGTNIRSQQWHDPNFIKNFQANISKNMKQRLDQTIQAIGKAGNPVKLSGAQQAKIQKAFESSIGMKHTSKVMNGKTVWTAQATGQVPYHSLESALMSKLGNSRLGTRVAMGIEEAVTFGVVETLLGLSHMHAYDKEFDFDHLKTSIVLGGAMGGILKFSPGGRNMRITAEGLSTLKQTVMRTNPWKKIDISTLAGRESLARRAEGILGTAKGKQFMSQWNGGKGLQYKGANHTHTVVDSDDLLKLVQTKKGAKQLQDMLNDMTKNLRGKDWWGAWAKEARRDMALSYKRMIKGGLLFTAPSIVNGDIHQMETVDIAFNFALGGVLSKNGHALRWKDKKTGEWKTAPGHEKPSFYTKEYEQLNDARNAMGMAGRNEYWDWYVTQNQMHQNWTTPQETPDVQKVRRILKDNGLIIKDTDKKIYKGDSKNKSKPDYEIYDYVELLAGFNNIGFKKPGERILTVDEAQSVNIKKAMKELRENTFESVEGGKGIENLANLHEVVQNATSTADKAMFDQYLNRVVAAHDAVVKNDVKAGDYKASVQKDGYVELSHLKPQTGGLDVKGSMTYSKYLRALEVVEKAGLVRIRKRGDLSHSFKPEDVKLMESELRAGNEPINEIMYSHLPQGEWRKLSADHHHELGSEWLNYSLAHSAFRSNVKHARELLTDLSNSNGKWQSLPKNESLDELFVDVFFKNGRLADAVDIAKTTSSADKKNLHEWANNVLKVLKANPDNNSAFTIRSKNNIQSASLNKVKLLRDIFRRNQLSGFETNNKGYEVTDTYINAVEGLTREHKVAGFTVNTGDGPRTMNKIERAETSLVVDLGLVDSKFNIVHADNVVNLFEKGNLFEYVPSQTIGGPLQIGKVKPKSLENFLKTNEGRMIEEYANKNGSEPSEIIQQIKVDYDAIITPKLKDFEKGGGFLNDGAVVATMMPENLAYVVSSLQSVRKAQDGLSHRELMNQVEAARYSTGLRPSEKNLYDHIYSNYFDRPFDSDRVLNMMAKLDIYDRANNRFKVEEPTWDKRVSQFIKQSTTILPFEVRTGQKQKAIRDMMADNARLNEVDDISVITPNEFVKQYKIETFDPKLMKSKPNEQLYEIYESAGKDFYMFSEKVKAKAKITHEGKEYAVTDPAVPIGKQIKFLMDTQKMHANMASTVNIKRLTASSRGNHSVESDFTMRRNSLLDFYLEKGYDPSIYNSKIDGNKETRNDRAAFEELSEAALRTDPYEPLNLRKSEKAYEVTGEFTPEQFPGYLQQFGDLNYYYHIPEHKVNLVAKDFVKFKDNLKTQDWMYDKVNGKRVVKKEYEVFENQILDRIEKMIKIKKVLPEETNAQVPANAEILKENFSITTKNEKNLDSWTTVELRDVTFKASERAEFIENMIHDMWMTKQLGKTWVDLRIKDLNKGFEFSDVGKILSRERLLANTSMTQFKNSQVKTIANSLKDYWGPKGSPEYDALMNVVKSMDKKLRDGIKLNLAADEGIKTDGLIPETFSINENIRRDVSDAVKRAGDKYEIDTGGLNMDMKRRAGDYHGKKDGSHHDAVTYVSKDMWDILRILTGSYHIDGIGAIKPIIRKTDSGAGEVLIGKTAFVYDAKWDGYFKNNKVDMLSFDTAAKIKSDGVNAKRIDLSQFKTRQDFRDHIHKAKRSIKMTFEDISLGAIVKPDKDAVIPYHTQMEYNKKLSNDHYNWLHQKHITEYNEKMAGIFGSKNLDAAYAEGLRLAKLDQIGIRDNLDSYNINLDAGFSPMLEPYLGTFKNNLKKKYLDDAGMFSPTTPHGSQSVLLPDASLRNTTFYFKKKDGMKVSREYFDIGEIEIGIHNSHKPVNRNSLEVVRQHKNKPDEVLSFKEVIKDTEIFRKVNTLGQAVEAIESMPDVFIKINAHRTPSTRISDNLTLALRGFSKDGNQVKVNNHDGFMRSELDFDIDKLNYYWDAPASTSRHYEKNAGRVPVVTPEPASAKTSAIQGEYSLGNAKSRHRYNSDSAIAAKKRGEVQKTRSLLDWLGHFKSFDGDAFNNSGFGISLGRHGGRIVINKDNLKRLQDKLSDDVQKIFDSSRGYNKDYFNETWFDNLLFGTDKVEGVFTRYGKGKDNKWEVQGSKITDMRVREIIKEAIAPYKNFLQVRTEIYENGKPRSVRYEDLLNHSRIYNDKVTNLTTTVMNNLLKKHSGNRDMVNYINKMFKDANSKDYTDVFGSFGSKASLEFANAQHLQEMMPFDRTIGTLMMKDKMALDAPDRLFEGKLDRFNEYYKETIGDNHTEAYKSIINSMKSDGKDFAYLNFLAYKKKQAHKSLNWAFRENNQSKIDVIKAEIDRISKDEVALRDQMHGTPEIVEKFIAVKSNAIFNDLRFGNFRYAHQKYNFLPGQMKTKSEMNAWLADKANKNLVFNYAKELIKKQPLEFKGIDSYRQANLIAYGDALSWIKNVSLKPEQHGNLTTDVEFTRQYRDFRRKYSEEISKFYNKRDVSQRGVYNNVEKIIQKFRNDFDEIFDKWEAIQPGAGRLMLAKIMAPEVSTQKVTYFGHGDNQVLMPAYKDHSMKMINFGLKWVASTNRLNSVDKVNIHKEINGSAQNFLKVIYGQEGQLGSWSKKVEKMQHIHAIDAPLTPGYVSKKDIVNIGDLNPDLARVFNLSESQTLNYWMINSPYDVRVANKLKDLSWYEYFPMAQIRKDYKGGAHPTIHANANLGVIKDKAFALLGDAASSTMVKAMRVPQMEYVNSNRYKANTKSADSWESVENKAKNKYWCK